MNLGQSLASARMRSSSSQAELAARLGISKSHLSRIESGHVMPSLELLGRLCLALGISERESRRLRKLLAEQSVRSSVLRLTAIGDRIEALADRIEALTARVERLEKRNGR